MGKGLGYLLGSFLALTPLQEIISQDDSVEVKEKVVTLLENYWNKEITLSEGEMEREMSKWPQELTDYMKDVKYFKTGNQVGNLIAFYSPPTNSYFVTSLKVNSENFVNVMETLNNPVNTKKDLFFLNDVNYYSLALRDISNEDVKNLGRDLEAYLEDAEIFRGYSIESVSHEMSHRLLHDSDGLNSEKNFEKPNDEEFRNYAVHLIDSGLRDVLSEKFTLYTRFTENDYYLKRRYSDAEDFFRNVFEKTPKALREFRDKYFELSKETPSSIPVSVNNYVFNMWKEMAKVGEIKFVENLLSREISGVELEYLKNSGETTYYLLKERPEYEFRISILEGKPLYQLFYNPLTKSLVDEGLPLARVPDFYNYLKDRNILSLMREEIEATCVNSLASVYFGPSENHLWPVDKEGYNYLSKFKLNGEPVFKRFLEKNEIARNLLAEGYNPEEIRKDLEFAEKFTHWGRFYSWPKSEIDIEIK